MESPGPWLTKSGPFIWMQPLCRRVAGVEREDHKAFQGQSQAAHLGKHSENLWAFVFLDQSQKNLSLPSTVANLRGGRPHRMCAPPGGKTWSHRGSNNACVKYTGTAATRFEGRRASYDIGMHCPGLLTLFHYLPLAHPPVPADAGEAGCGGRD